MIKNIGSADKIIRYILGVLIIAAGFYYESWWGIIGAIPIITATINWCPVYLPFGMSTCKTKVPDSK
ncbi:MAG: DUF2892 domain-containing protein [Melioribacteraceae bacterium]|nr:DUF2892 domain-containing protein [Melioribacteraceae bacterium]MCF8355023.1 DUF2892 domain-containing protein [Melioribacteraceae bacterium]MCF8392702.1 DUF2892 domain-containing protein [Melioribacteraceae bacterium]MCF8417724.1 DUF2892 domain-containing protein [Melioribacteraceae bacterium]